ncbi:hypothetical protein MAM1_0116d05728 [Mucor ambiguus]|uniref:NADH:flavin oxidoreductase/NADH oxidase N-terminal domain-containing protein n=1 Tax=Mucor ambiguus TaxID=91626 RepID=A0A0C9MVX3_9FUNG|nr:hypothetical protein MAM1_0116d05728 [Mucor ambiguus]
MPQVITRSSCAAVRADKAGIEVLAGGEDADGRDTRHITLYAKKLKQIGTDVIDISSDNYIKKKADTAIRAVGIITETKDAEDILQHDQADYMLIARELLRDRDSNRERYLKTVSANKKYG